MTVEADLAEGAIWKETSSAMRSTLSIDSATIINDSIFALFALYYMHTSLVYIHFYFYWADTYTGYVCMYACMYVCMHVWWLVLITPGGLHMQTLSHTEGRLQKQCLQTGFQFKGPTHLLGNIFCDKPLTTCSQWHTAYFTALALRFFAHSGHV